MKARTRSGLALGAIVVCALAGSAAAQTAPAATTDVGAASAVAPDDQVGAANKYLTNMEVSAKRVRHLLDEARRNKDVVKVTCLQDKLVQIETAIKSTRERVASLKSAVARGDNDLRNHEFSVLGILKQRVSQLDAEANQCIGEEIGLPGDTRVTFSVDPNIAPYDPGPADDPGFVYVPPLPASPFD